MGSFVHDAGAEERVMPTASFLPKITSMAAEPRSKFRDGLLRILDEAIGEITARLPPMAEAVAPSSLVNAAREASLTRRQKLTTYRDSLPRDFELPVRCTDGSDVVGHLLREFKWNLRYGDLLVFDEPAAHDLWAAGEVGRMEGRCWFPFSIYYNWCRNVTLCMINLRPGAERRFAYKGVQRPTDYTVGGEGTFTYLPNYYGEFVIPNRIYHPERDDADLEPFYQTTIKEGGQVVEAACNGERYVIDFGEVVARRGEEECKRVRTERPARGARTADEDDDEEDQSEVANWDNLDKGLDIILLLLAEAGRDVAQLRRKYLE